MDVISLPEDTDMRGYRLLEKEAEEVVKCVKYNTEEDVVRLLLKNNKESREICTIIVKDGSTALHAMAQQARPHIMKVRHLSSPYQKYNCFL